MKDRLKRIAPKLAISLPLIFVLLFFGYFPIQFQLVLQTKNIIGEGICQTYVCPAQGFAAFYKIEFYFGSELKKATLGNFHYDLDTLQLVVSDVSEFDITGMDSYIKGIHLAHIEPTEILPNGSEIEGSQAKLVSQNDVLHVEVFDKNEGATISLSPTFIPMWFWILYSTIMVIISALMAVLFDFIIEKMPFLEFPLFDMTCIAVTLLAGCFFCGSLPYATYTYYLLNWLFLFAASLVVNALTLPFAGTLLTMVFTTCWYIANFFVIQFRSKPIMPADLKAAGTAAEVAGGYIFTPTWQMILGVSIVISYAVALISIWRRNQSDTRQPVRRSIANRLLMIAMAALLFVIGVNTETYKSLSSFAWDAVLMKSFHEEGMVLTFLKSIYNTRVEMPEGYSQELVSGYLKDYQTQEKATEEKIRPTNIIMIMNEAFSDLRTVGLNPDVDVMPFIDSLDENTVEGSLFVSVIGGGTCNTEFEALTGNSLAFLSPGAYPYTENVTTPLFSLAEYFKGEGYSTDAFHPNSSQNWNRNMVYPNMGFEKFHAIDDFETFGTVVKLHDLPADIADYQFIESLDDMMKDHPRFMFDVTMQNHAGYERWLDVEKAESVEANGNNLYVDTQVYLSLIKASDDEVKQLVETYRDDDEPTMIIFFGDHQPSLPSIAYDEVYSQVLSQLDIYRTKFFVWTNYDTEEWHQAGLSANFLPWLILDQGNFDKPPFVQMLEEVYSKYPIITSQGVMDIEGNIYTGINELIDDPLIKKYQYIQYANLFDELDHAWFEVQ